MPDLTVALHWEGTGLRFRGGAEGGPEVVIDGDRAGGPSPMGALALGVAGCMAVDVLDITQKMRLAPTSLSVTVEGDRRDEPPRHFTALRLRYVVGGVAPADEQKVWRAIDLSREKYCSVLHSLRPDIEIAIDLDLR